MTSTLSDHDYHQKADALFFQLQQSLDQHLDVLDWEMHGEILYLNFEDGEKIVINKQAPLHQVWFASKEGGKHFGWLNETWTDIRSGETWYVNLQHLAKRKGLSL
jgi:CyaY protein